MVTIEALLTRLGQSDKYVFGNKITAADVLFYPQAMATKKRWEVDMTPYPNASRILENL